jgi:hypothetical protein
MRIDYGAVFGVDFALHGYQRAAGDLIGKKLRSGPGAILFALGLIQRLAGSGTYYRRVTKFLAHALGIDLAAIAGICEVTCDEGEPPLCDPHPADVMMITTPARIPFLKIIETVLPCLHSCATVSQRDCTPMVSFPVNYASHRRV